MSAFLKKRPFLQFSALFLIPQENVENLQPSVLKKVSKSCVLQKLFAAVIPFPVMSIKKNIQGLELISEKCTGTESGIIVDKGEEKHTTTR